MITISWVGNKAKNIIPHQPMNLLLRVCQRWGPSKLRRKVTLPTNPTTATPTINQGVHSWSYTAPVSASRKSLAKTQNAKRNTVKPMNRAQVEATVRTRAV